MKKNKYYILIIFGLFSVCFNSCKEKEVFTYNGMNALSFEYRYYESDLGSNGKWIRLDTVEISANHYPNKKVYTHKFKVNLIGVPFSEPTEYKVVRVLPETEAEIAMENEAYKYISIPENPMFSANIVSDNYNVDIAIDNIPRGYRGYAIYKLEANQNFREGFANNSTIKIWINNITTKPSWWLNTVEQVYLGVYTEKKFSEFVARTGLVSLDDVALNPGEDISIAKRRVCREFKRQVKADGVMDGDVLLWKTIPVQ